MGSSNRLWEFLLLPKPPQCFTARGFTSLVSHAESMGFLVRLSPQLFFPAYLQVNVGPSNQPAHTSSTLSTTLLHILSSHLPISAPPTSLDAHFFFNSLVVKLLCSLFFFQFWLFFVFKLVVILISVVRGSKTCLPMPPSWSELSPPSLVTVSTKQKFLSSGSSMTQDPLLNLHPQWMKFLIYSSSFFFLVLAQGYVYWF